MARSGKSSWNQRERERERERERGRERERDGEKRGTPNTSETERDRV